MAQNLEKRSSNIDSFESLFAKAEQTPEFWLEGAILEFTDEVLRELEHRGISRSELATRIGASRPQITRLLSGRNNFTLKTMVAVSCALGCTLRLHLQRDGVQTQWIDYVYQRRQMTMVAPVIAELNFSQTFKPYLENIATSTRLALPQSVNIPNEVSSATT